MKLFVMTALLSLMAATATAQEAPVYVEGLQAFANEQETETQTIIVIGRRPQQPLDLPYEAHRERPLGSLTADTSWGEQRFTYTVPLYSFSDSLSIDTQETWVQRENESYHGAPTRNGRRMRLVCRLPLTSCLGLDD